MIPNIVGITCSVMSICGVFLIYLFFLQEDYYFEYTECHSSGSRWRAAIPRNPGACVGLPDPVRGTDCSKSLAYFVMWPSVLDVCVCVCAPPYRHPGIFQNASRQTLFGASPKPEANERSTKKRSCFPHTREIWKRSLFIYWFVWSDRRLIPN